MAGRANVGHPTVIVDRNEDAQSDHHRQADRERPPHPGSDPAPYRADLDDIHGDADGQHHGQQAFSLGLVFHDMRYVPDGFDGNSRQDFESPLDLSQLIQFFLLRLQLMGQQLLLLFDQHGDDLGRGVLGKQSADIVNGKAHLSQKTNDAHFAKVILRVQSPPTFGKL